MFGRMSGGDGGGFSGFLAEGAEMDGEVRLADEMRIDGKLTGGIR